MNRPLLSLALLLASLLAVSSQSVSFTYKFSGGLPFCTQCGALGEYACSPDANGQTLGNWNNGLITFRDPVPLGNYATGMTVTLTGSYACNAAGKYAMFGLSVNGNVHAVRESYKSTTCKCDTCDGSEGISFSLRNGIPGYKYSGNSNTLQILSYVDSICLNRVNVTINYAPITSSPPVPLPENYLNINIPSSYDRVGCPVCNSNRNQWCSSSNNNTLRLEFTDPLPSGFNYVVAVDAFISLNFIEKSITSYSTLSAKIQNEVIASKTLIDTNWRNKCGCFADYQFNSATYQRGWPGYVQKGKNTISFELAKYSQSYGNICIGRLAIKLVYFQSGEDEPKEIYLDQENLKVL